MKLWRARFAIPVSGGSHAVREEDFYLPEASDVREQLRSQGCWPISITERQAPLFEWMEVRTRAWQLQLLRALRFQAATASAGTALLSIIEGERDARRRLAFLPTRTVLKGGGTFSDALRELRLFDAATMAIITAGERAGDLKGVIGHAIEHIEEKGKQIRAVKAALGWLSFDIFSVISSVWSTQFGFIPYLRKSGIQSEDPAAIEKFTTALNRVSNINIFLIVLTTAATVGAVTLVILFWQNRDKPDHPVQRLMMRIPLFSTYLCDVALADSCKLMARLLRGFVPLTDAINILAASAIEPSTRLYWTLCAKRLMSGAPVSRALALPPLHKFECDQIASIQSVDQLAEVYEAIASERALDSKTSQRKIVMAGIVILAIMFAAVVLTMIYLLMVQNQGLLQSVDEMRGAN
jgi:type II secretory pathway component PulF